MIILDEKMALPPPPPYVPPTHTGPPPPFPHHVMKPTLTTIPPYILLRIVYETFSRKSDIAKQRKTLYWLNVGLRLVNRATYVACMHVLRSTYLPAYSALVRAPYTSDPFPHHNTSPDTPSALSAYHTDSPVLSLQRETRVLDLFISLKVREDVWADDTEFHLERDESFRDLFDLMQPKSRVEDLVRLHGVREGVVDDSEAGMGTCTTKQPVPVPFSVLSVSFSSRRVGLILTTKERKRTIVEVERARDEKLEVAAKRLVQELKGWCSPELKLYRQKITSTDVLTFLRFDSLRLGIIIGLGSLMGITIKVGSEEVPIRGLYAKTRDLTQCIGIVLLLSSVVFLHILIWTTAHLLLGHLFVHPIFRLFKPLANSTFASSCEVAVVGSVVYAGGFMALGLAVTLVVGVAFASAATTKQFLLSTDGLTREKLIDAVVSPDASSTEPERAWWKARLADVGLYAPPVATGLVVQSYLYAEEYSQEVRWYRIEVDVSLVVGRLAVLLCAHLHKKWDVAERDKLVSGLPDDEVVFASEEA
ncbi:hypothetical protein EUX98_g1162 [Antrodiella citrinella]|uniref:Uncharacterized protein n=1 Tax=Antrodiella citrinella TaxID=2447956 RepID=A0A4V3XJG7_9APHY|nr:hypothetical protein EUX98_g1162 [Antrodiella citrinella]